MVAALRLSTTIAKRPSTRHRRVIAATTHASTKHASTKHASTKHASTEYGAANGEGRLRLATTAALRDATLSTTLSRPTTRC
jgi:hypothetical protein